MTEHELQPSPRTARSTALITGAVASAAAGLVHAAAAGTHSDEPTLAWLFAATAVAQLAWAALVLVRAERITIAAGSALNAGAALAWVLSRTVGLFGPLADVEPVGTQDLLAAVLALLAVAAGVVAITRRSPVTRTNLAGVALAGGLVLALAVPAMAAEHVHSASHDHGDAATHEHEAGTHTDAESGEHHHDDDSADATGATTSDGPVVSLDDPRLTDDQVERATTLIDQTRTTLAAFPDEAAVVAAGYVSIGDGRRPNSFEHFVSREHIADDRVLDTDAIESIVMQVHADGTKTVVSAMYILPQGSTMSDVPEVAGELSTWHDHQNLCWDATGQRLAGILVNGECRPGGVLRVTPPMLHVWLEDTPCGPFAGIEGHGGSCKHSH